MYIFAWFSFELVFINRPTIWSQFDHVRRIDDITESQRDDVTHRVSIEAKHNRRILQILLSESKTQMMIPIVILSCRTVSDTIEESYDHKLAIFDILLVDANAALQSVSLLQFGELLVEIGLQTSEEVASIWEQVIITHFSPLVRLVDEVDYQTGIVCLQHKQVEVHYVGHYSLSVFNCEAVADLAVPLVSAWNGEIVALVSVGLIAVSIDRYF